MRRYAGRRPQKSKRRPSACMSRNTKAARARCQGSGQCGAQMGGRRAGDGLTTTACAVRHRLGQRVLRRGRFGSGRPRWVDARPRFAQPRPCAPPSATPARQPRRGERCPRTTAACKSPAAVGLDGAGPPLFPQAIAALLNLPCPQTQQQPPAALTTGSPRARARGGVAWPRPLLAARPRPASSPVRNHALELLPCRSAYRALQPSRDNDATCFDSRFVVFAATRPVLRPPPAPGPAALRRPCHAPALLRSGSRTRR